MSAVIETTAAAPSPQPAPRKEGRAGLNPKYLPLTATISLFVLMATLGSVFYDGFFSAQVFLNLLIDNAFLIVVAVGMTFVILSGGIDLSVGSVIALTTMVSASLVEKHGWSPAIVIPLVLAMGTAFGAFMGLLIERFRLQPFIVTLAGMFLARGLCYLISIDSISITNEFYSEVSQIRIPIWGEASVSISAVIAIVVLLAAVFIAHCTPFGRAVYAIGGSLAIAERLGYNLRTVHIFVFAYAGFLSGLAGIVHVSSTRLANPFDLVGNELDVIAAVILGGARITGGSGTVGGTLLGVVLVTLINNVLILAGVPSTWQKVIIGAFILVAGACFAMRKQG